MARNFDGSDHYGRISPGLTTLDPPKLTVAFWLRCASNTVFDRVIECGGNGASPSGGWSMEFTSSNGARFICWGAASLDVGVVTDGSFGEGPWRLFVLTSDNDAELHIAYKDNVEWSRDEAGTRSNPGSSRTLTIAGANANPLINDANIDYAYMGIWNDILTAEELTALLTYVPWAVAPEHLVDAWEITGVDNPEVGVNGTEINIVGGNPSEVEDGPALIEANEPLRPTVTIDERTGQSARWTGSAYEHDTDPAPDHAKTWVQIRKTGQPSSSAVTSVVTDPAKLLQDTVTGLEPLTFYDLRIAYEDENEEMGSYSPWVTFQTTVDLPAGDFDPAAWKLLWNTMPNILGQAGGWAVGIGSVPYLGRAGQFGRFLVRHGAIGFTGPLEDPIPTGLAHDVVAWGLNIGDENNWWPWLYTDTEGVRLGVGACLSGEYRYDSIPQATWNPYAQTPVPNVETMSGVEAYIEWGIINPWGNCNVGNGWVLGGGYETGSLVVRVWYNGDLKKQWSVTIPRSQMLVVVRKCQRFPWYALRLRVDRDYDADPTGRVHRIRAGWAPDRVRLDLLDADTEMTWQVDETWEGGLAEESSEDAGDAGLPCGMGGVVGGRFSGHAASMDRAAGASLFDNIIVNTLTVGPCEPEPPDEITPGELPPEPIEPIQTAPCPQDAPGSFIDLFMGEKGGTGGVFQYGGWEDDPNGQVVAQLQTNPFAGAGFGGEMLVANIYVTLQHRGDVTMSVTPIANGELLTSERKDLFFVGTGEDSGPVRRELALSRPWPDADSERFRNGVRCQDFAVLIHVLDICQHGFQLDGLEVEWEPVRESIPGAAQFVEKLLAEPFYVPPTVLHFGEKGGTGGVLGAGSGHLDDGQPIEAEATTNWVLPEGVGGECLFTNIYLTMTTWSTTEKVVYVTPQIIQKGPRPIELTLAPVPVTIPASTAPITKVYEVPVTVPYSRN